MNIEGNHQLAKVTVLLLIKLTKSNIFFIAKIFITNIYKQQQQQQTQKPFSNNQSSSIFSDENYLKSYLIYCDHCLDIVWENKQVSYCCKECPNFVVCEKCIKLMSIHHPTQHRFTKNLPVHTTGKHFGVTCNGCNEENISGLRYQCIQCKPSYDLCLKCFQKGNTIHNKSHTYRFYRDPLLRSSNQQLLAQRTLALFHRQKIISNDQRDPFTGWTKIDAEQIIQRENQVFQDYKQRLQEENKRQLDIQKEIADMHLENARDIGRMLSQRYCPNCGAYY